MRLLAHVKGTRVHFLAQESPISRKNAPTSACDTLIFMSAVKNVLRSGGRTRILERCTIYVLGIVSSNQPSRIGRQEILGRHPIR